MCSDSRVWFYYEINYVHHWQISERRWRIQNNLISVAPASYYEKWFRFSHEHSTYGNIMNVNTLMKSMQLKSYLKKHIKNRAKDIIIQCKSETLLRSHFIWAEIILFFFCQRISITSYTFITIIKSVSDDITCFNTKLIWNQNSITNAHNNFSFCLHFLFCCIQHFNWNKFAFYQKIYKFLSTLTPSFFLVCSST